LFFLLSKIADSTIPSEMRTRLPDEAVVAFLEQILGTVGSEKFKKPRDFIRPFAEHISGLIQDPNWSWRSQFNHQPQTK